MPAELQMLAASAFPLSALATQMAQGFEGYFVTIPDDPAAFAARARAEQIDLSTSLVATLDGEAVGQALIARRGSVSRLAAMSVRPAWRGQGVGAALLDRALADARARGDREMRLEVIEANEGAARLYERRGFQKGVRLAGYEAAGLRGAALDLREVALSDAEESLWRHSALHLPWQMQPATLSALTTPTRAFRLEEATAWVVATPGALVLRAMVVPEVARRQGQGRALLSALTHAFPDVKLVVPAIVPEPLVDGFLRACGFTQTPLAQWEMTCSLP